MKRRNQGLRTTRAASLALAALMASAVAAPPALADAVTPSWSFTNCGKAGRFGPSLADCQSAYSDKAWAQDAQQFRVVDGVQYWTVPVTARYSVTVQGASSSGKAARFTTHVDLKAGQSLKVLVGQQPTCWQSCGGGGGTYVATSTNEPIAVAGGGGGRGRDAYSQAIGFATPDARFVTSGGEGRGGWSRTDVQSNGGVNGQGGGSAWCGTGGGGFYGRGAGGCWGDNGGRGGRSFIEGGIGDWSQCGVEDGGFGGGGAGHGCWDGGGGGGGGYSGGGGVDNGYTCGEVCANRAAGGGGSFWAGTPAEGKSLTTGAGRVDIRFSDQATAVRATSIGAEQVRVSWASPSDVDQAGGFVESLRVFASTDGGTT
ncbi:MAG: hypothetical protein KGN78_14875, partial [Actinomycetales bacterium]|nr:hypothetical protein [Actinomycetales bacterium]